MMIRSYVKSAAAQAVSWTGLDAVAHAKLHGQIPFVAAYHRVVERLNADRPFALPAMEISAGMEMESNAAQSQKPLYGEAIGVTP